MDHGQSSSSTKSKSSCESITNDGDQAAGSQIQLSREWTVYDSTQNLAAVLNDPRLTKRESDFFTKTWGDSFSEQNTILPCPHLPVISRQHFLSYLKKTSKRSAQLKSSSRSANGPNANERTISHKLSCILENRRMSNIEPIPKIFTHSTFDLENPETFNSVLPLAQIMPVASCANTSKSSVKLLQEKLSHYLDLVEVQIAHQISLKSEAFFQAMTSHDALMEQLARNVKAVSHLRKQIQSIDDILVKCSLKSLKLKQTRYNCLQVYQKLKLMATVHQTQPTVQLLLSTSEFAGALDLISTTKEIAEQELVGIYSFRHLSSQLAEIERIIDKMMQADFVRHISSQLNRPLTVMENGDAANELDVIKIVEEERLVAIVLGLLRLNKYEFVDTFLEESKTAVKTVIKQTQIEAISKVDHGDIEGENGNFSEQIRLLDYSAWLDLLQQVFKILVLLLKRIKAVQVMMLDIVNIASGTAFEGHSNSTLHENEFNFDGSIVLHAAILSAAEHLRLTKSLKDMMVSVCDQANTCCVSFLSLRASKEGMFERIRAIEFIRLAQSIEHFTSEGAILCGKPSPFLKLALEGIARKFVDRFHKEKTYKLSQILDSEQWKQADVAAEFQHLVDYTIKAGSVFLCNKANQKTINNGIQQPESFLFIGTQKFAVIGTVLLLLTILVDYCDCANDVPIIALDLEMKLLELLRFYNSRTCQLILGAGALQLVGLKTITTKNLALASRSLQLIVLYIPLVKNHFERLLIDKQQATKKHFDQVLKDYNHHINDITNKFVGIIDSKIESLLSKWVVKAPVPSPAFRSMSKHLSKLHEAVVDLLPEDQLQELFRRIHFSFIEKLKTHLVRLKVNSDGGPQHGLVTQELTFYMENLKILNIFPGTNQNLEDFFNR